MTIERNCAPKEKKGFSKEAEKQRWLRTAELYAKRQKSASIDFQISDAIRRQLIEERSRLEEAFERFERRLSENVFRVKRLVKNAKDLVSWVVFYRTQSGLA